MDIRDLLSQNDVMIDVRASDKVTLLRDLSARAAREVALDPLFVADEVVRREQLGSTGVGAGVAIPHARIPGLERPLGILARLRKGLDFAAIDGKPVDVVFLLLLPGSPASEQLNALAAVARQLRKPSVARSVRMARDRFEARSAMLAV